MFENVDHIGIATKDINRALEVLEQMGGPLKLGKTETIESFGVTAVMVAAGAVPIELVQPLTADSGVAKFLEKKGEGVHHIAYRVENIDEALQSFKDKGFQVIDQQPREGYAHSRVAFIHPKGALGVLTELVQREPGKDIAPYDPA
jgi:methylmalonyl-CoA epimerase